MPFKQILLVILVLSVVIIVILISPIIFSKNQPLPAYSASNVQKICELFGIGNEDNFCKDLSEQNAASLDSFMRRKFPVGQATLSSLTAYLNIYPDDLTYQQLEQSGKFAALSCETPLAQNALYSCYILFPPDIGYVTVFLDKTSNQIKDLGVSHPSSS